jgi:hypothetical protein
LKKKKSNKRSLLPDDSINQPDGKRIRADLGQEQGIKVNLQRDSEREYKPNDPAPQQEILTDH